MRTKAMKDLAKSLSELRRAGVSEDVLSRLETRLGVLSFEGKKAIAELKDLKRKVFRITRYWDEIMICDSKALRDLKNAQAGKSDVKVDLPVAIPPEVLLRDGNGAEGSGKSFNHKIQVIRPLERSSWPGVPSKGW